MSLFSLEVIARIAAEGHPIGPGTTGENLTVEGLDWSMFVPGALLGIGDVVLEVTRFTTPCRTIRGSFLHEDSNRIHQRLHPSESRVYARVLTEGAITAGEVIEVLGGDHA